MTRVRNVGIYRLLRTTNTIFKIDSQVMDLLRFYHKFIGHICDILDFSDIFVDFMKILTIL